MNTPSNLGGRSYDDLYKTFDSPLAQQLRREAYGTDIGQHSWVTVEDLNEDIPRLQISRASSLLDLGCGPCGPLSYILGRVGCRGSGVDLSADAITAGLARAAALGLEASITLHEANLNGSLPFADGVFNAVISLDVILHLRNRAAVFQEVARVLGPTGRFLFTDAGVVTGAISDQEIQLRSVHGYTQFVPEGFNERTLQAAGFRLVECEERTAGLVKNARGRLAARHAHRPELERLEGAAGFHREQQYLEMIIELAERRALVRMAYLGELSVP